MRNEHPDMLYRELGRTGERVSAIGVGGFHLASEQVDETLARQIVRTAIEHGVTFMDNCWDYNEGASETRSAYRLLVPIQTRWADNDSYGHVNNATYYSYFDTAVNLVLTGRGLLDLHRSEVICMVAETLCRFHRSLSFPDAVEAGLRIGRMGRSSVRWEIALFRQGDASAAATGHFVHVYVDRATRRTTSVPEDVRRTLADLMVPGAAG